MVFTLRAQAASSYALTKLKDGSATSPSLGFANADSTGFYLDSSQQSIGITGGDGTATHPTLNFGHGKGVYATDSGLGLTGGGSLEGAVIQHHPSGRVWRSHSVLSGSYDNIIWVEDLGMFVTSASGNIVTSKDGETWNAYDVGVTASDIAWSPTLQRLVAVKTNTVWTSPDAVTWTEQTAPSGAWRNVTWAPSANKFIAVQNHSDYSGVISSSDGITWQQVSGLNLYIENVYATETAVFIMGWYNIYKSVDGVTWERVLQVYTGGDAFTSMAYSDTLNRYVVVSFRNNRIFSSDDGGNTWTVRYTDTIDNRSVVWCDGQFLTNQGRTSQDGITWTTDATASYSYRPTMAWSPSLQKVATVDYTISNVKTSDARTTVEIPGDLNVVGTLTSQTVKAGVTVTKIQITDNAFSPINDTALDTATGGYIVVTGRDFASGVVARVGPTTASSTAFISSTEIRIQLPAKAAGTYPLELVHSDGTVTTIPNAITYSPFPTWITDGSLAGTSANGMPFSFEIASSDSALGVVTANATYPVGTTVATTPEGNTVAISGTITAPTTDTLYSFDATVEDAENQDLATKTWQIQHAATYYSQHLGNAVVQSFTTAQASATIDASSDTLTDTTGNVVEATSATGSTAVAAAGHVLDGDASTVWTTAATYDPADGSYTGAVSTTVEGNAVLGEYLDLVFDQAQTLTHLAIRPLDGSTSAVPVTFTVAGQNGGTWTLVHTQASAVPLADGTETVVTLDTPGSYSSYRVIAQTVGVGEDAAKIAGVRTWADGLPLLEYAHPITLVNGHVMARVGTTAVVIDPSAAKTTTVAVGLTPTAKPALLPDGSVFWPPAVGYTIGYRVVVDGTVTSVSGIAADVSNAVLQADGTVLMLPSSGTTAQSYDPSSEAVANVTAYSLPGSEAVLEPTAVPGGVLALPNKAASGSLVQNGAVTTTTALFGANYNEVKLVASDAETDAQFGYSCSMSADGTRVVIGAVLDDATGGTDSGAAYVFSFVDGAWTQEKLVPSDSEGSAEFGSSCSMSADGTRVVIGARLDDATGGGNSGAAYVFSLVNGVWTETKLIPNDSQAGALFGSCSMNASGDRVVIGARYGDANSGAAYVFSFSGGTWTQEAKLVPNDIETNAQFGFSTSMNSTGNRVVIGAWADNTNRGAAYVFSFSGGTWTQDAKLVPNDSEANMRFGVDASMNSTGDRMVIGAYEDNATGGSDSGAAYIFSLSGGTWTQDAKLVPNDSEAGAQLAVSVSMRFTGDRVVIGAQREDATGGTDSGAAYVFSLVNGGWIEDTKLIPSDSEAEARFCRSCSMNASGDRVVIGAFLDDAVGLADAGAAYVYDLSSAGKVIASGNALVAKGSTVKSYDLDGDTVTSTAYLPTTVSDLTILDDGRVLATSAHDTAMTYDPVSGNVTSLQGPRSLGRATRLLDGKVWTEGGVVFQSGSSVSTPLTATIGLSSFVNP